MATTTRSTILEAAVEIVATAGAAHFTIDAVAAKAAVSKGGVLYHFKTKQALLEGMLERLLDEMAARAALNQAAHQHEPNAPLIARIIEEHDQRPAERAMSWAILAAAAEDPASLAPARVTAKKVFDEAASGSNPPEMGWVLVLATEGLRMLEMLKLLPLSRAERARVHTRLLSLAREYAA